MLSVKGLSGTGRVLVFTITFSAPSSTAQPCTNDGQCVTEMSCLPQPESNSAPSKHFIHRISPRPTQHSDTLRAMLPRCF